jgi:hypothetical protein
VKDNGNQPLQIISVGIEIISDHFFCIRKVDDKGTLVFDIAHFIFFMVVGS